MISTTVAELQEALRLRFEGTLPLVYRTAVTAATGIDSLDGMLPNGGLPRGRLSIWAPGGGATAILRTACVAASERGERAAWVDAAKTVAEGWPAGVLLVRPAGGQEALVCAEELLRSGGFALVVLAGAGRAVGRQAVRLSRSAKEGGSALVVVTTESLVASLRLRSVLVPEAYRWRHNSFGEPAEVEGVRVEVEAASLGWSGHTSFWLPVLARPVRLATDPLLVDRRGVVRKPYRPRRSGWGRAVRESRSGL